MQRRGLIITVAALLLFTIGIPVWAIGEDNTDIPEATIVNDEGGAAIVRGSVTYTNPFFTAGISEPLILLEDQTGFVLRDRTYILPIESQQVGQITTEFAISPFDYVLGLPVEPIAPLHDFDNDANDDTGVMVFAVAYWANTWGDYFLEARDQFGGGWSTAYASTLTSPNQRNLGEYIGGKLLVYAPEAGQAFPSGFGEDGMLFTVDDPLVIVPTGYTMVDINQEPFVFDRSREPQIDLLEGEGAEVSDFSDMNYVEAFDELVTKFRTEYAFTDFYEIDWDSLHAEYRPEIENAEAANDNNEFSWALQRFLWQIPDGHIGMTLTQDTFSRFVYQTDGGLGIAIRELTDGRIVVNYLNEDTPADDAGVELGAEIISINGTPIEEHLNEVTVFSAPFSTDHVRRLQQLRYATRFPLGTEVTVEFRNPDGDVQSATMTAIPGDDSFSASSFNADTTGYELPVEYVPLEDYVYVQISSFLDDRRLTIQLWERMIENAKENRASGIVIDMRNNGGGSGYLADQMAAYFFDEPLTLGRTAFYDNEQDQFVFANDETDIYYLPPEDMRFDGEVVIIVGPNCASACEFFSYNMTLQDRATIVGEYPSAGLGGSVERVLMPDGISVQMTTGRAVDPNDNIHIEGQGVQLDVVVPVTIESLLSDDDTVLQAAIQYLDDLLGN